MSAPFRDPCSRHLVRLPGSRGHACAPLGVCTCVSTPGLRLANCLCHCTSVHRPCISLQCGIVWQTAFVTVRLYTDFVLQCDIVWQTAFVTVHLYTDLTHLLVRHCLANCLCHCTSVYRPCTSFRVQHCLANCLCHCTSVHRSLTSFQCSIVWQTAFVALHLYIDLSHLLVRHCLANCLCRFTSVHRSLTSFQCSIVWQTAFLTVHLYADLVLLHRVAVAYWFVV